MKRNGSIILGVTAMAVLLMADSGVGDELPGHSPVASTAYYLATERCQWRHADDARGGRRPTAVPLPGRQRQPGESATYNVSGIACGSAVLMGSPIGTRELDDQALAGASPGSLTSFFPDSATGNAQKGPTPVTPSSFG